MTDCICLRCQYLQQEEQEVEKWMGYLQHEPELVQVITYWCEARTRYIRLIPRRCKHFTPLTQTKLVIGGDRMVEIDEIPSEGARLDLANLPKEADLIVTSEKFQETIAGKAGGLILTFQLKDGRTFQQKYTKVSGAELLQAMKKLGLKNTLQLQQDYYHYELTQMRIGFPRMIPKAKCK